MKRQKISNLCFSIVDFLIISQQRGGTIAFHKKVTMKTLHTHTGKNRKILNYTPTRKMPL
jgi:hypothetical protein